MGEEGVYLDKIQWLNYSANGKSSISIDLLDYATL